LNTQVVDISVFYQLAKFKLKIAYVYQWIGHDTSTHVNRWVLLLGTTSRLTIALAIARLLVDFKATYMRKQENY
jgi:hypothetical protein